MPHAFRPAARVPLLAAAALFAGCASLLGIDDEKQSAVDALCSCGLTASVFGGSKPACVAELTSALAGATEQTRAAWMKHFESTCAADCDAWPQCFALPPTCTGPGDCRDSLCRDCCQTSPDGLRCVESGDTQ